MELSPQFDQFTDRDLWKQQRPADVSYPQEIHSLDPDSPEHDRIMDEYMPKRQAARKAQERWDDSATGAIAAGELSPDEARERGWKPITGHEREAEWEPLPRRLYHTTTDVRGVLYHGLVPRKYRNQGVTGLGGSGDNAISTTDDHGVARNILLALHEMHGIVSGKTPLSELRRTAQEGHRGSEPFSDWFDKDLARKDVSDYDSNPNTRYRVGQSWLRARDHRGGLSGSDPLFFTTNPQALAATNPDDFGVLHLQSQPGSMGYRMSGMNEWRVHRSNLLVPTHVERASSRQAVPV